ncbi:MAG: helix-turn-helix domain-containing protein [Clostridia bacterium]|nr:helix-turn-helix domain-containing protein [Clostridia bacterium]
MANRLFQGIIQQMKDSLDRVIGVIDEAGIIIACSDLSLIGESRRSAMMQMGYLSEITVVDGYSYRNIGTRPKTDYMVFVEGEDEIAAQHCGILSVSFNAVKQYYDEKYDRSSFVKNILLDNILPGDIFLKSKELHFINEAHRAVFLIRISDISEIPAYDMIASLFPEKGKDYVISISEEDIVLVKEVREGTDPRELVKLARSIVDTVNTEFYSKVHIGIGTVVDNIKDLARSFKEAQVSIEVSKVFDTEKSVVNYENLGIGRLIYQLPTTLCTMFLQEVFKKGSIENLDAETLSTIQAFFENNLNVSETSRKLFVHRNTLVYRLEKIRKLTGLDLREFDNAITFKVALMVKRYLITKPTKF